MQFLFWFNIAVIVLSLSFTFVTHFHKKQAVTRFIAWVSKGQPVVLIDYERKVIPSVAWVKDGTKYSYYSYWHKVGRVILLDDGTTDKERSEAIFIDNWYTND